MFMVVKVTDAPTSLDKIGENSTIIKAHHHASVAAAKKTNFMTIILQEDAESGG